MTITGTLTGADNKKHIPHTFEVPTGTTQLHIQFDYLPVFPEGARNSNQISLTLFDPNSFRGARHNNADQNISLSAQYASPGYLAGPLPAGTWSVYIDTHRIIDAEPVQYTLDITLSDEPISAKAPTPQPMLSSNKPGPRWYRGDLHGHTLHSDGNWGVPDFVAFAKRMGLDFVTLTDHNTVSGLAAFRGMADADLLTMGGMELTTYYGHALALGTPQWHEWRTDTPDAFTMPQLARRVLDSGAFYVIAHPRSPGDPDCTGCRWEFEDMLPGNTPAVEIWNGPWSDYNEAGLQLYYDWLNAGHKLVATSGTDIHGAPPPGLDVSTIRVGMNVVYADTLTEDAILLAIRQGHSYISAGPLLHLNAIDTHNDTFMMGDTLTGTLASVRLRWAAAPDDTTVRLLADGNVIHEQAADASGAHEWQPEAHIHHWYVAELRDAEGSLWAVTNPIFVDA